MHLLIRYPNRVYDLFFFFCMRTAPIMTSPFTVPCKYGEIPSMFNILFTIPRIIAPITVPNTVPLPPLNAVPPMITAAIASS